MGSHIIDGEFQSDKYPTTPRGKVPLSVKDKSAQDLLWEYAQRRRAVDAEFADDLEAVLKAAGFGGAPWASTAVAVPAGALYSWIIRYTVSSGGSDVLLDLARTIVAPTVQDAVYLLQRTVADELYPNGGALHHIRSIECSRG